MPKLDLPKLDLPKIDLPKIDLPKLDLKTVQSEATKSAQRALQAGIGATDYAVGVVRGYANAAQKSVTTFDPQAVPAYLSNTATEAYDDLVKRGQVLVGRIRRQQSTQDAVAAAETTVAKARTTRTQTAGAAKATKKAVAAKRPAAKRTAAKSSAKATRTSAKKTVSAASRALADAAEKVGD